MLTLSSNALRRSSHACSMLGRRSRIVHGAAQVHPCFSLIRCFASQVPTLEPSKLLDSTKDIFATQTTAHLLQQTLLFEAVSVKPIVTTCINLLSAEHTPQNAFLRGLRSAVALPLKWGIKIFGFPMFTGGETLQEAVHVIREAKNITNVGAIIDHSTEEFEDPEHWNTNLSHKLQLLDTAAQKDEQGERLASFAPIKITSLLSPTMLETLTAGIESGQFAIDQPLLSLESELGPETWAQVEDGIERLSRLCEHAAHLNVSLLFDAEQSYRQAGVHSFVWHLMGEYNKGDFPVVYDTFQMYLRTKTEHVKAGLKLAEEHDFTFAAKVVRGAYVVAEQLRADEMGQCSPLHVDKAATDEAYDSIVRSLIARTSASARAPYIVVATHNQVSVQKALEAMEEEKLAPSDPHIHIAQIRGMCDSISLILGSRGYNALKLVPYGQFEEVLPWLLRRLTENQDIFGAAQFERILLKREIKRRLRSTF